MALIAGVACVAALAQTPTYKLGRTPSEEEIRAWDIAISPDGKGLPPGSGTAQQGAKIYAQKCALCHGPTGAEGPSYYTGMIAPFPLVGGPASLGSASFAAPTWDSIKRYMPVGKPGSLNADEVYALTAFLLYRNGIIKEDDVIDAQSLPKLQMPKRK